jgi:hypothetical protein
MLESVGQVCLDLLYDTKELVLTRLVEDRANLENWSDDKRAVASELLSNDVHRAQLAIDIFSSMGDQEIFDFVGIQSF